MWLLIFLGISYLISVGFFAIGLYRSERKIEISNDQPFVSIIVAARNEEANISRCLDSIADQTYPIDKFEIVWIDDNSTDHSIELLIGYQQKIPNLIVLKDPNLSGKASAIDLGIRESRSEIIITTDADCTVPKTWIEKIVEKFSDDVGMVISFSVLTPIERSSFFVNLQTLELIAIFSLYIGCLRQNFAFACSGNNLAYRRSVYFEIGGFERIGETVADDNLLLQTVDRHTDWKIVSIASRESIVRTPPQNSIRDFISQRIRWGSNNFENRPSLIIFMYVIYFFYVGLIVSGILACFGVIEWRLIGILILCKILPEILIVWKGLRIFDRRELFLYFFVIHIFQICYIILCVLIGSFGSVVWKERKLIDKKR